MQIVAITGPDQRLEVRRGVAAAAQRVVGDIGLYPRDGLVVVRPGAHAAGRAGIAQRIAARAAVQRVVAGTAVDRVVALHAGDGVGVAVAGQRVVIGRARHALDARQHVTGRVAAGVDVGQQIDRDRRRRPIVIDRVVARAADHDVATGIGDQRIVAGAAVQRPADGVGIKHVVIGRAGQALDIGQRIALRVATDPLPGIGPGAVGRADVDIDRRRRGGIVGGVVAVAAVDRIRATHAGDHVVAIAAQDDIGIGIAGQRVVIGGAGDVLDIRDQVALRVAILVDIGGQVYGDTRRRSRVIDRIDAVAAIDRVGAAQTRQRVVARAALQRVGVGVAGQRVGIGRAGEVLDVDERVARGVAARGLRAGNAQVDRHARARRGVIRGIGARAAIERVGAPLARQHVVARAAGQHVGVGVAGQCVVVDRAGNVLEIAQDIARRIAARHLRRRQVQVDRHTGGRIGI